MHISTPTSKDRNKRNAQYEVCRKKKKTLRFIRNKFRRSCLPLTSYNPHSVVYSTQHYVSVRVFNENLRYTPYHILTWLRVSLTIQVKEIQCRGALNSDKRKIENLECYSNKIAKGREGRRSGTIKYKLNCTSVFHTATDDRYIVVLLRK